VGLVDPGVDCETGHTGDPLVGAGQTLILHADNGTEWQ
jgi:hypothetical protein